ERMYFPIEPGVARPAWRVLIWQPVNAFYVIVDAGTGTVLWRKNITADQTASATYDVYNNTDAFSKSAKSPFPWIPGPTDPSTADAATDIGRSTVSLIGNEAPNTFNNNGWITDGGDRTDGNAVQAGLDIDGTNGVDPNGEAIEVTPMGRDFQFTFSPYNPNTMTGDAPSGAAYRSGGVTQLFYICNRYHDSMYLLGFTEDAFNFQDVNFTAMGVGGDRVSAESQDSSGTNNANFSTPADGGRGRMQMYRWTLEGPGLDGSLDADIVIHEHTHGLSNRLHGNSSGLNSNMSGMMGEGWSDFYAHALLSEASDPANGIYTLSGWATSGLLGSLSSYYYGIRRFPKAPMAFTGGAMSRPHNPITFADIDQTTVDYSDGAFPAPVAGHLSSTADQVHSGGEVWSSALWEVRTLMVARLGFPAGNERALQVVTDGMKLAPLNPTYIQERDAIIAAAAALPVASLALLDVEDVREGFRIRGMGFSATVDEAGNGGGTARVTEAFDIPNVRHIDPFAVSDAPGDNDGFPEPGEDVLLSVPVTNATGAAIGNVVANVNGGSNVAYGTINDGQTVTMQIPYTVNSGTACGAFEMVNINVSSDEGAQPPVPRSFRLGEPVGGAPPATFENTTPLDIPAGQPTTTSGPADPYPSTIAVSGLTGDKVIEVEITQLNHTWVGDVDMLLVSPGGQKMVIMSDTFSSSNRTNTVVVTVKLRDDAAGPMPSSGAPPAAGTFQPTNHGTTDTFDPPAPAGPYQHPAPGGSATFQSAFGIAGSAMNGNWHLYIDDDADFDPGTLDGGWKITFESDNRACSLTTPSGNGRADFDGDGRTDLSVFRASEGNWYMNQSTGGFMVTYWGLAGDTLVPGDYDGDGKADQAVFRPADAPGTPDFFILNSSTFTISGAEWGLTGDVPVIGDYDGDGKDDIAVFRDSDTTWYILNSGGGATFTVFGNMGDTPTVGDFDGDGSADPTTFNAGTWTSMLSGGGTEVQAMGLAGDVLVPGDYDGDGQTDHATWRDSTGSWYIWYSLTGVPVVTPFGLSGDIPVPGDYDGDGKDDFAIYRGGEWWVNSSQSGGTAFTNFGLAADTPIPSRANP
ncbi:MAG: M36 family metallopeptidase, partial [Acidobacteriota bacterium]|nr:M36 family metallopeptidase [Acidobacteriota bacterium]